ncbi:hypothetical protein [Clostridium sp.]|uniref:hypothetical protein n=1 Tax=Clostridium sp. TaxID=1506 RepID=UPI003F380247
MKNVMKEAHEMTKRIIKKGDNYKATFRLCLIFVHSQIKKVVNKMVELKGTEKQVKYASDIRNVVASLFEEAKNINIAEINEKWDTYKDSKKEKFGSKENLINSRIEKIEAVESVIMENEDAKFIIETFKNVLGKPRSLQAREIKEIANANNYGTMVSNSMQKIENAYRGK